MTRNRLLLAVLLPSTLLLACAKSQLQMSEPGSGGAEYEAQPATSSTSSAQSTAQATPAQPTPALAPEGDAPSSGDAMNSSDAEDHQMEATAAEAPEVVAAAPAKNAPMPHDLSALAGGRAITGGQAVGGEVDGIGAGALGALGYMTAEEMSDPGATRNIVAQRRDRGSKDRSLKKTAEARRSSRSQDARAEIATRGPVAAPVSTPVGTPPSTGLTQPVSETVAKAITAEPPPPPAPTIPQVVEGAEQYVDHGVNPFTMTLDDELSTFSVDVDTASYTIARRKLGEGGLPPEAAVRAEEFINYFDYDYPEPDEGPFDVHMESMPDPFRPGHHILRVGVQGDEVSRSERPPIHLTFLVDVSGSMSSADKLRLVQKSLHMLVDSLNEEDTVALATYAGRTARILEPTPVQNKRRIHDAIGKLKSGGSTAMSAGIDIAYQMAMEDFHPGHENRVIVLSDGDANVGNTSWDSMLGQIKGYADKGVTLSTIGFGMGNYKDHRMEQLSNKGDGNNFYIDDAQQAQRVFVDELGGTLLTIARDVKIQVEFNPESVAAYRLIGYENRDVADKDFRNDRVDAGEVGSGHNVTALYDVLLKDGYSSDLATVRLRWEQPGPDSEATEQAWSLSERTLKERTAMASRATRMAYSAGTFAEILRGSPHTAEISLSELARFAASASRPGEKDDRELVSLIRLADSLGAGGQVASR